MGWNDLAFHTVVQRSSTESLKDDVICASTISTRRSFPRNRHGRLLFRPLRGKGRSVAFQFHPEKSGTIGLGMSRTEVPLKKRIIICLDVKDGRTTKGVKFLDNVDIGDPVIMADAYYAQGVDELVFYDIMASAHDRGPTLDLVANVAKTIHIPFCVGGGISSVEDIRATIKAGAEKVSLNSPAVRNPALIREGAAIFGNQCIVLGMDAKRDPAMPSGYRVYI